MQDQFQDRRAIIQGIIIATAVLLLLKTMQLQILDSSYHRKASDNVILKLNKYPSRGLMFDRNGALVVNNNAMYDLMVIYDQVREMDTVKFCNLLGITKETFHKNLHKDFKRDYTYSRYKPYVFLSKISSATFARFQESLYEFPGFYTEIRNVRGYSFISGAHVLGYLGEASPRHIEKDPYYRPGDYLGISGIEAAYEKQLRGRRGVEQVLRNNLGRIVGKFEGGRHDTAAISGNDLMTTLDIKLQQYGELLLKNKRGAIVAIEPSTGEILAMVSAPDYDPNLLTIGRARGEAFTRLNADPSKPLFNRAMGAQYPPGSIFKPVMALVAMQEGVLDVNRGIGCPGGYRYKSLHVNCHSHPSAGNVAQAIQHSCNAYFCQVLRDVIDKHGYYNARVGMDTFVMHLHRFGLGVKLNSDVPNELAGNVPTSAYYDKLYKGNKWVSPYLVSLGIGQAELLITPLQMANMTAVIANRGYYYPPHLAKKFLRDTTVLIPEHLRTRQYTMVDSVHFGPVIDGMEAVVLAGTARASLIPGISMCGKTGTAENPHGKDHSAFIAFAPKHNPKIAIAVFVENSGWGGSYAAPIASLMIEQYLRGEISESRKVLEERMTKAVLIP